MTIQQSSNRPNSTNKNDDGLVYQYGFGNTFQSEVLDGALPIGRNNPRLAPYQLYTEQLSGTAFTAPRNENKRTWLYRIQPSVVVGNATSESTTENEGNTASSSSSSSPVYFGQVDPQTCRPQVNPLRWKPLQQHEMSMDFVTGMKLMCTAGDPASKDGLSIYMYAIDTSMSQTNKYMYNADGDFLIVPQMGALELRTELGRLRIQPTEIVVIPRGIVFQVELLGDSSARGYTLEIYNGGFALPELGPIVRMRTVGSYRVRLRERAHHHLA